MSINILSTAIHVFLEIKKKYNGIVNKRRSTLKLDETYRFIKTGNAPHIKEYMNEFGCAVC